MSSTTAHGHAPDSPSGVRPLPPRPNLEYERKQAKHLLRRLHDGDPDALRRVDALRRDDSPTAPQELQLSDAQFTIAREYGFLSWPRLVEYFTTLERHERSGPASRQSSRIDHYEGRAKSMMAWHRARRPGAAAFAGSFVPRLHGLPADQVLNAELTVDEARLIVARENRLPSWEALVEFVREGELQGWEEFAQPRRKAHDAIRSADLSALQNLVEEHPELLTEVGPGGHTLLSNALVHERRSRSPQAAAIRSWLAERGADLGDAVNSMLLGHMGMTTEDVQFALELGADPTWVPPNGISVIEHAIYRYWNGEAVDIVARLVTPPEAFWVAAGLGDVRSLPRYIDAEGRLTKDARKHRPDFMAMGIPLVSLPAADDLQIIDEAFFVAALNGRFAVMDVLLHRGYPIDHDGKGGTLIQFAVGNGLVPLVDYLINRGAQLDKPNWRNGGTARSLAEAMFLNSPDRPEARRVLELCGGRSPDVLIAESAAKRAAAPLRPAPKLIDHLRLAEDEAAALGQTEVTIDNLFVALLQPPGGLALTYISAAGVDMERLRDVVKHRLRTESEAGAPAPTMKRPDLPGSAEVTQVLEDMHAEAKRRHRDGVHSLHLLWALMQRDTGPVADILRAAGATPDQVRAKVDSAL